MMDDISVLINKLDAKRYYNNPFKVLRKIILSSEYYIWTNYK